MVSTAPVAECQPSPLNPWKTALLLVVVSLLVTLAGCGGGGGNGNGGNGGTDFPDPVIITTNLPDGVLGVEYQGSVTVTSLLTITWSVSTGSLPAGLSLNSTTGQLTGTPTAVGVSTFTIQVSDTQNQTDSQEYTVAIGDPADARVERVSLANDGSQGNSDSGTPALNEDGRFIAFTSFSDNLVANDTNGFTDVFIRDRTQNCTVRVSVASDGTEGNSQSFSPALSSVTSGRLFVAYASDATNLVPGDTNERRDVFVTVLDVNGCPAVLNTVRASIATDGTESDGASQLPHISANGLVVTYTSAATNLASADANNVTDAFVTELSFAGGVLGITQTRRVSLFQARVAVAIPPTTADIFTDTTIGRADLMMTADEHVGREAFVSQGTGAGQLRAITANDATTLTVDPAWSTVPDETSVFRILAQEEFAVESFTETTIGNSVLAMVEDEATNLVVEITVGTGAGQQRLVTANDETTFTIEPAWDDLPDASSRFRLLLQSTAATARPRLSADGALVVFDSANRFELEDTNNIADIFLHTLATGMTTRVSLDRNGDLTNGASDGASLDADGGLLLFRSLSDTLLVALPPTLADIFSSTTIGNSGLMLTPGAHVDQRVRIVEGAGANQTRTITENTETTLTVDPAWDPVPDDTSVFQILSDNNAAADLFLRDLNTGEIERVSLADDGSEADGGTDLDARMSAGGRLVAFATTAANLVDGDRNGVRDVYLRDRQAGETHRLSLALGGTNPRGEAIDPAISLDGSTVAFSSTAENLVDGDDNDARDIFLVSTGIDDPPPVATPVITSAQLASARLGESYGARVETTGGVHPLLWVVTEGKLPPGLFLDSASGRITGVPRQAGQYRFTVTALDGGRPMRRAQKTFTLTVTAR